MAEILGRFNVFRLEYLVGSIEDQWCSGNSANSPISVFRELELKLENIN